MNIAKIVHKYSLLVATSLMLTACGGSDSGSDSKPDINKAPQLALSDSYTFDEQTLASISATASDEDGTITSYNWQQTSGDSIELEGQDSQNLSFTTPLTTEVMTYGFTISVSDNDGATAQRTLSVIVNPVNESPKLDLVVVDGNLKDEQTNVLIEANASDIDGEITNISWRQVGGVDVDLANTSSDTLTFTAPVTTEFLELSFEVSATDNEGATTTDTTSITINPVNLAPSISFTDDITINEQDSINITPVAVDADGSVEIIEWTQISGAEIEIIKHSDGSITFEGPVTTQILEYTFEVTVTDNEQESASDSINITVLPVNELPQLNAGEDFAINQSSLVKLTASAFDVDGEIVAINWIQIAGELLSLVDENSLQPSFIIPQDYLDSFISFEVEVIDNEGAVVKDIITIEVLPTLTFIDYELDSDPQPLVDVNVEIAGLESSQLTPANNAEHGYSTHVIDNESEFNFIINDNVLEVTGDNAPDFAVGDIVVGIGEDQTHGFMRKITAINGNILSTEIATFSQTFPSAELNLQISVYNSADSVTATVHSGQRVQARVQNSLNVLSFERRIQHQFAPGIKTVTDLSMNSALDIDFDLKVFESTITDLKFIADTNYSTATFLDIDIPYEYSRQFNKEFNPIFNVNRIITVGAIPLLINVQAVPAVGAGIGMSAAGSLHYGFQNRGDISTGIEYTNSILSKVKEFTPNLTTIEPVYSLEGGIHVDANAKVAIVVSLYEIDFNIPVVGRFHLDGPSIGVDMGPYAKFEASSSYNPEVEPALNCLLDLTAGVDSHLAIDYGSLGRQLNIDSPENILLFENGYELWSSTECPFTAALGSISGTVADNQGSAITGVNITIATISGQHIASTTSDANGLYNITDISVGTYHVTFSKEGFIDATASIEVLKNYDATLPQVLFIEEQESNIGTLSTSVVNAQDPSIFIEDAQVLVRKGLNNPAGEFVSLFYSSTSAVSLELEAGYYTLEVSKTGYDTIYESISIQGGDTINKAINLSANAENVDDGEARIVLTWGRSPSDLDSHITFGSNHVYFARQQAENVTLDVDDTSAFGPETITVEQVDTNTTYSYYIYNFSRNGTFVESNAQVKLYYDGTTRTYNPPSGAGYYWRVFSIENGVLIPCQIDCVGASPTVSSNVLEDGTINAMSMTDKFIRESTQSKITLH